MTLFRLFVIAHICTGAVGLVLFWVPVIGRKGSLNHRKTGKIFAYCILATACSALGMSLCTLSDPLGTHPRLTDAALVSGLFGWMMFYLAILTISLVWHGLTVVSFRSQHRLLRHWWHVGVQVAVIVAGANCARYGAMIGQPLMLAIPIVGIVSGITNLVYIYSDRPARMNYLKEHVKALVGAGISVYTAFMTFGLAQLVPSHAFNPTLWAIPIIIGISIIVYHQQRLTRVALGR